MTAVLPSAATAGIVAPAADYARRRIVERERGAEIHAALLKRYGLTPETCPVCENCPDWLNRPRSAQ